jgi:glucose/arabinose dehydrogenase
LTQETKVAYLRNLHPRFMVAAFLAAAAVAHAVAQVPSDAYRVETVATPEGIAPEVTAVTFAADGRLYATFRRGYIYSMDPQSQKWRLFASGLQSPLGILAGKPGEFFVAHLPELTRVVDTDGDGLADLYETVTDQWGMSGNYHEFAYGPVRDAAGNLYMSLGCASNGALPRFPVRGEYTAKGKESSKPAEGLVNKVGHYSPVQYRGCVLRISRQGEVTPVSCGLRQPNGLGLSPSGDLFVTDNQGDWVGTSPLHHVTPGAFHGHPSSLNWDAEFHGDPVEAPVAELAKRRKLPAIQFPQNDMGGSVAQPLFDTTAGAFGPYSGQVFIAEWTYPRILRADLEKVGGEYQGAAFIFVEGNGLQTGNNRVAFSPDGKSLYTAQTSRIWGAAEGLQRIVWTGRVPMDILRMQLTRTGFRLTFTKPVDPATAANPSAYSFTHYYYFYHGQYGSPKAEVTSVAVRKVAISQDGLQATLELDGLIPGRVYELQPSGIQAADGEPLATRIAAYSLNRLLE